MHERVSPLPVATPAPRLGSSLPAAGLVGAAALAAVAFGLLLPDKPFQALALLVVVPLALAAPVASLSVVLFITVLVPFDIQNHLAVIGGEALPGLLVVDVVLLVGLCRVAALVATRRLPPARPLLLAGGLGLVLAAGLVEGIAYGAGASEAGHEARRVAFGVGGFILAWPVLADEPGRRRLFAVLIALGLALGASGLAQWILGVDHSAAGDIGVRPGVDETSAGRGQLQGGLYGYPVAVALSFAALASQRVRSLELRQLLWAILLMNSLALLVTYERTLWAGAALACLVAAMRSGPEARRAALRWAPTLLVLLLLAMAALGELKTAAERLLSVADYKTDQALEHRRVETENVARVIADRPLTGSGFGATITWGKEDVFAVHTTSFAHNGYLWLAWKIGILAAGLFVLAILAAIFRRPPDGDVGMALLRTGSQAALVGLLLINITFPDFNALGITAVMGLMVAACFWSPPRAHARTRDPIPG